MVARASLARDRQLLSRVICCFGAECVPSNLWCVLRIIRIGNVARDESRVSRNSKRKSKSRECREVAMSEYAIVISRSICVTRVGSTIQRELRISCSVN